LDLAGISVRKATAADAGLLADLGARTFHATFAADNSKADMSAYLARSFSADIQARELADSGTTFLVVDCEGAPVGYARLRSGGAPACVVGTMPIEIVRFYSDMPWIGRGVGGALMRACLGHATSLGCDVVWLDVWEHNTRAIGFYEREGFTIVGEQDFVLGSDVQRDLLMARGVG
jgi:ribosomal protein S18 acetylase RimI-like enzyme